MSGVDRRQLILSWAAGILASVVLVYIGIREDPGVFLGELFGDEDPKFIKGFFFGIVPILILGYCAYLSTTRKFTVVWIGGALVSAVLFYIGIGRAILLAHAPTPGFGHWIITVDYRIGLLGPMLVLAACALWTILRRRDK